MCNTFLLKILRGCPKALQNTLLFPYAIYLIQISKNELGNSQKNQKKKTKRKHLRSSESITTLRNRIYEFFLKKPIHE